MSITDESFNFSNNKLIVVSEFWVFCMLIRMAVMELIKLLVSKYSTCTGVSKIPTNYENSKRVNFKIMSMTILRH